MSEHIEQQQSDAVHPNFYYYHNASHPPTYHPYYPIYGYQQQIGQPDNFFDTLLVRKAKDQMDVSDPIPPVYYQPQLNYMPYTYSIPVATQNPLRKLSNGQEKLGDEKRQQPLKRSAADEKCSPNSQPKAPHVEYKQKESANEVKYVQKAQIEKPQQYLEKVQQYVEKQPEKTVEAKKVPVVPMYVEKQSEKQVEKKNPEIPKDKSLYVEKKVPLSPSPYVEKKEPEKKSQTKKQSETQSGPFRKGSDQIKDIIKRSPMQQKDDSLSPCKVATVVYSKEQLVNIFLANRKNLSINSQIKGIKEDDLPIIQPNIDVVNNLELTAPCIRRKDSIVSASPFSAAKASPYTGPKASPYGGPKNRKDSLQKQY